MVNPNDIASTTKFASVVGNHGGHPPDSVITLDGSTALERPRSPSVTESQPSTKKGRCMGNSIATGGSNAKDQEGDLDMNLEDGISDSMELIEGTISSKTINQNVNFGSEHGSLPDGPSFKDKLLGSAGVLKNSASFSDLDVDVKEEDVCIDGKVDHRSRFDVLADVPDENEIGTEQTLHEAPDLAWVRISSQVQQRSAENPTRHSLWRNHPRRREPEWRIWQSTFSGSKEVRGRILPSSLKRCSSRVNSKASGTILSIKQPDNSEALETAKRNSVPPSVQGVYSLVSWIQNSTFEPLDGGEMQV
ncbi:hypothetical protein GQ457_01G025320 [Hibiscus cannabinus]